MDDLQKVLGQRIQVLRKRLGFTQQAFAEQVGFAAHQIVSQIEQGTREIKAWELIEISKALRTDIQKLLAPAETEDPVALVWRDYGDGNVAATEAAFIQRCERHHQLEEWLEIQPSRDLPQVDIDARTASIEDVRRVALDISRTLNLGSYPAASLVSVLENDYAIKIWYEDLGESGSAASAFGKFGYGIMMHREQPPWRRNFSFAHELFHLITRDSIPPQEAAEDKELYKQAEKLAERFAGMLLLPNDILSAEFDRLTKDGKAQYSDVVELARRFEVSTGALLWGLVSCGKVREKEVRRVLDDPAFRQNDRITMSSHWWQPPSMPERFVSYAFLAYQKGKMSRARLAKYLEVSLLDLPRKLAEYGLDAEEELEGAVATS